MRWIPTLLPLALVGCGGESEDPPVEQGGAPEASASIPAELWPDDAVALLLVPSADHLVQTALEISAMFADEPPPFPTDGAELLALAGASGALTQVDLSRPLAVTLLIPFAAVLRWRERTTMPWMMTCGLIAGLLIALSHT